MPCPVHTLSCAVTCPANARVRVGFGAALVAEDLCRSYLQLGLAGLGFRVYRGFVF
jgi:hypothetical protein